MEYASTTLGTAAKTNKSRLNKVQNMALRLIFGAMETIPVHDVEKIASVEPLERRRGLKILIQVEKTEKSAFPPSTHKPGTAHKIRLERQSLNHQYKELCRKHQDIVDVPIELLTDPVWRPDKDVDIQMFLSVPGHHLKGTAPWRAQKPHPCPDY